MFDPHRPPFLVIPFDKQNAHSFPESAGYIHHPFDESRILVSHGEGWTFPVSVAQHAIPKRPLLLVRDKGGVTSEGSSSLKGYAHQFVDAAGNPPAVAHNQAIFSELPDDEWMLIESTVDVIWMQYGYKNQYLGEAGTESMRIRYGKLIILRLTIEEDLGPSLDRRADMREMHNRQYRVCETPILNTAWSVMDKDTWEYLGPFLKDHGLAKYHDAIYTASERAGYRPS